MAIYKLFPEKDTTLYSQNVDMNTGLDEILEASTYLLNDAAQTSRYLLKFSQNEINGAYTSYISGSGIAKPSTIFLLLIFSSNKSKVCINSCLPLPLFAGNLGYF